MQRTILLLSRDANLSFTRAQILERAGYRTASSTDVTSALALVAHVRPSLVIVGHSFLAPEQESFVESLQEAHPGVCVMLLRFGLLQPVELLAECEACFAGQPGRPTVRVVEPGAGLLAHTEFTVHSEIDSANQLEPSSK